MIKDCRHGIFQELRIIGIEPVRKKEDISDKSLAEVMTLDANMQSLGYTFTPDSFALLACADLKGLSDKLTDYIGHVDAEPMYPGFPDEVMKMDEATFRFHQILHYMSTYGVEFFTGTPVSKGWLPESNACKRDKSDTFTTDLKQIEVVDAKDLFYIASKTILSRKVRLTNNQNELIQETVSHLSSEQLETLVIPFKENVQVIFDLGVQNKSLPLLKLACKNPMDAFKYAKEYLDNSSWHLKTSQKRIIAKLWDSFDNALFEENLIYSNQRREMVIRVMDHIDYSTYSRNSAHVDSVNLLKDKKLHSWMSCVEKMISAKDEKGLFNLLKQRPGMLLRMGIRLISLGYAKFVKETLTSPEVASKLSTQTIVDILNVDLAEASERGWGTDKVGDWKIFKTILKQTLRIKLSCISTDLKDKKIYLDTQDYDVEHSMILKSEEGGYNRGGMAFKIPESVNKMRFFVYWNDGCRVDVDLHASFLHQNGVWGHVGWNGDFKSSGIVTSGDITHSDAAEYIDIDMNSTEVECVSANINLYSGRPCFSEIDTCFTGLMAVKNLNEDVKLYDAKSCFISHELTSKSRDIHYGLINIKDRFVRYVGTSGCYLEIDSMTTPFSLKEYLDVLFEAQGVTLVDSKEDADCVIGVAKGNDLSLIDENFYLDL